jgi:hypothetical protein
MHLDISRDFLDALSLVHPPPLNGREQLSANGGIRFLPSSPDGKLHTVVAVFTLAVKQGDPPFAQGGWRFLFTSAEKFAPEKSPEHPFLKQLLVVGTGKLVTAINNLCLLANLPILPIDIGRLVFSPRPAAAAAPPPADGATPS